MSIHFEKRDTVTVVYLSGILNALTVPQIQTELEALIASERRFILEMSQVKLLSSIGLWMLLHLHRQIKNKQGKIILVQLSEPVAISIKKVGFESFLLIFDTLDLALGFVRKYS